MVVTVFLDHEMQRYVKCEYGPLCLFSGVALLSFDDLTVKSNTFLLANENHL